MSWDRKFISQSYNRPVTKCKGLPVYKTDEFDFYRCLKFEDKFYGRTASKLFNGNLRESTGRYSSLFPGQKISYWADSPETARAEIKAHGADNNILTFWAYDDATSTFPTRSDQDPLVIIDGRKCGVQELIDKVDNGNQLSKSEEEYFAAILKTNPDCLAYDSHANKGGENFIFFEKGFRKLSLRELSLRFAREAGGNHNQIACACASDYFPSIEAYGKYFAPKAKVMMKQSYLESEEYQMRKQGLEESHRRMGLMRNNEA